MSRISYLILIMALALLLILPACAKKDVVPVEELEPVEEEVVPPPPPPLEEVEEEAVVEEKPLVLGDVFFDYDKFTIKDEFKKVLSANAEMLMGRPGARLLIEGHCDERGTNEYNLSLGEKRAKAVLDFYTAYGVGADRLSFVSYGEERPFDPGHTESAWSQNRRAHMVVRQ